jgi:hypothetical protein
MILKGKLQCQQLRCVAQNVVPSPWKNSETKNATAMLAEKFFILLPLTPAAQILKGTSSNSIKQVFLGY